MMFNRLLNSIPCIRRWRLRRAWRRFDAIRARARILELERQLREKQNAQMEAERSLAMRRTLDDIQEWQAGQAAGDAVVEQFANLIDPERAAQERDQAERQQAFYQKRLGCSHEAGPLPPQPWPGLCDCGHWYED
jgi:Na+-translocating ferredoxin:NAD+ oxidoreductase RnfC subunit